MKKTNHQVANRLYYQGHEQFIARIHDLFDVSLSRYKPVQTSFLSMVELTLLYQQYPKDLYLYSYGGHEDALRKIVILSPFEIEPEFPISILVSQYDVRNKKLEHKDVLGALMNLGIERNQIGDIYIQDQDIVVFCTNTMQEYIMDSCHTIGRYHVSFQSVDQIEIYAKAYEEIKIHVSSLRLDAVVSALGHCSRKKALDLIAHGDVKLNDVVLETNQQLCNNDFVSIRRIGKFQFKAIESITKKNRLILQFNKFV